MHDIAFTLYPAGHVPYGQVAVIPLARDGSRFVGTSSTDASPMARWGGSLFEAAIDAADGRYGDRFRLGPGGPWRSSRQRHLVRTLRLVGLDAALDPVAIASVEHLLKLEATDRASSRAVLDLCALVPMQVRGQAVRMRLEAAHAVELDQLMVAGFVVGLWARPWRWQRRPDRLRDLVIEAGLPAVG